MRSFNMIWCVLFAACVVDDEDGFNNWSEDDDTVVDEVPPSDNIEVLDRSECQLGGATCWSNLGGVGFVSDWDTIPHAGPGVASADFDGDGDYDLAFPLQTGEVEFYRQVAPGSYLFWQELQMPLQTGDVIALSAADYDGDGVMDLLVLGDGVIRLWRGSGGGFDDVTEPMGLFNDENRLYVGASWGDVDRDGDLDVVVACHQRRGVEFNMEGGETPVCRNLMFRNDVETFVFQENPITETLAVTHVVRWVDFDRDGDLDLFVGTDKGFSYRNSQFWENVDGTFIDRFTESVGLIEAPMGAVMDDFDRDGDLDLWVTDYWSNRVFTQSGGTSSLIDVSQAWLQGQPTNEVPWSPLSVDMDGDGIREVFVTYDIMSPDFPDMPQIQTSRTWKDQGGDVPEFVIASEAVIGRVGDSSARGSVVTDLNSDGSPDVLVRHRIGEPDYLLGVCNTPRFTVVLSDETTMNRDGVGAVVTVHMNDEIDSIEIGSTSGSYSSGPPVAFFSPATNVETIEVVVVWPDGGDATEVQSQCTDCTVLIHR